MKKHGRISLGFARYRIALGIREAFKFLILETLPLRYRFARRISYRYRAIIAKIVQVRVRLYKRLRFRFLRLLVFFMWRLWVDRATGLENIPEHEAAIIISNHASYYDFFVLASVLKKQAVFVAAKGLDQRSFVGWFMKLDTIIYVDREKPGYGFFKELLRHLSNRKLVALYPEGTRSRSGQMIEPKTGFVKLALKANVPVIPVAMKGTYEILPPHRHLPRLRKCDVHFGKRIYISPATPLLRDIFFRRAGRQRYDDLNEEELSEIAFRVMNEVRKIAGQEWDPSVQERAAKFGLLENKPEAVTL